MSAGILRRVDNQNRLQIPKTVRDMNGFEDIQLYLEPTETGIILKTCVYPVKIDDVGRIEIPESLKEVYRMKSGSPVEITPVSSGVLLKAYTAEPNEDEECKDLVERFFAASKAVRVRFLTEIMKEG